MKTAVKFSLVSLFAFAMMTAAYVFSPKFSTTGEVTESLNPLIPSFIVLGVFVAAFLVYIVRLCVRVWNEPEEIPSK